MEISPPSGSGVGVVVSEALKVGVGVRDGVTDVVEVTVGLSEADGVVEAELVDDGVGAAQEPKYL